LREETERSYEKWQAERTIPTSDAEEEETTEEEPDEPLSWDTVDKNGKPTATCTNTRRALKTLGIICRHDVFHDRFHVEGKIIKKGRANLDHTVLILRTKIHKAFGFDPGTKNTNDAIVQLCLENEFDPVLDYLNALHWDGTPRLERWLIIYAGAEDTELNREFGRIALIAAVRRARYPGIKFDPIIVLEGPMGTNKSKTIEVLAGVENFSDQSIFGVRDREQQELLSGIWLYEIAELSNIRKTEVEHIKAFASRTHDRARPAYGHHRVDQPRRCVLFATTNNDQYLKEADRRFWPLKTKEIDIEALRRDRDQLWAEAAQQEKEGALIELQRELWETAGVEQQEREEADPWDDVLSEAIGEIEQGEERISSADLLSIILKIDISKQRDIDFKRAGRCMRRLGWSGPKKTVIAGKHVKGYTRPEKE
jgi:predicted P-loop ATPase